MPELPRPGTRVGAYRIDRQLWQDGPLGGWLAAHVATGAPVIVQPFSLEPGTYGHARGENRRQLAKQWELGQPSWSVPLLELLERDGYALAVRAVVRGAPLSALALEGTGEHPISAGQVLYLCGELGRALAEIGAAGGRVALSPQRAGVSAGGRVVLGGVRWEPAPGGAVDGPLLCLAPELLGGGRETPASRAWSLGATLFQLLTGAPAIAREGDLPEVLRWLLAEVGAGRRVVPDPRTRRPALPAPWAALVLALTELEPAARPAPGGALASRLRELGRALAIEPERSRYPALQGLFPL